MAVLQGKDWEDFVHSANFFLLEHRERFHKVTWVGIPRKLVEAIGSRKKAIQYVKMIAPWVNIHLLGFSDDMVDDFLCARMRGVKGIDSAVPLRVPGLLLPTDVPKGRDPRWMDEGGLTSEARINVSNVRQWINPRDDR